MSDYITKNNTIIFAHKFNSKLDINLLSSYSVVIWKNYKLNLNLFDYYEKNDFRVKKELNYFGSKFNQKVNN